MEKLLEILKSIKEDVNFMECENLIDGGYLDSFDILQLITAISEEYEINIPATEILPSNFNSMKNIKMMIDRLTNE